jgi:hypothetical protein
MFFFWQPVDDDTDKYYIVDTQNDFQDYQHKEANDTVGG